MIDKYVENKTTGSDRVTKFKINFFLINSSLT